MATLGSIAGAVVDGRRRSLETYGDQLMFYVKALAWTPRAIRRYPREITNTLAEVTFGAGGLTLIAGTVGVIAFLAFFAGTEVGIQGYASLSQLGVAKFSAFISAYFNPREVAPLISSIALAATVGCGYTARLGAMRISEEIDALEVMGIPSLPFLVTTRMIAAFIAVIPLYVVALMIIGIVIGAGIGGGYFFTVIVQGGSAGAFLSSFTALASLTDLYIAIIKAVIFGGMAAIVGAYKGLNAGGGPSGVGRAVNEAVIIAFMLLFFLNAIITAVYSQVVPPPGI